MKFIFSCSKTISHSFAALDRELSIWTLEDKFHIFAQPCIILYLWKVQWSYDDCAGLRAERFGLATWVVQEQHILLSVPLSTHTGAGKLYAGGNPTMDYHLIQRESRNTPSRFMLLKPGSAPGRWAFYKAEYKYTFKYFISY